MSRYLDPKSDFVFKKIFGEHADLLKSFLNAVLPLEEDQKIASLEYLSAEQAPKIDILKRPIVEVKCKDVNGRIFIVEMQIEWTTGFMQRMLFNSSNAYVKQLGKGDTYTELKPVYGLALLSDTFSDDEQWYHHYRVVNTENSEDFIDGLQLIFIELPKYNVETPDEKRLRWLWLKFLKLSDSDRALPEELYAVDEIKHAVDLLESSSYTEAELEGYERFWDSVSTQRLFEENYYKRGMTEGLEKGIQQGIKKGIEKGRTEVQIEIAKALLANGMDANQIKAITGLPNKTIESLKKGKS